MGVFCEILLLIFLDGISVSILLPTATTFPARESAMTNKCPFPSTPWPRPFVSFVPAFVWNGGYFGNPRSRSRSALRLCPQSSKQQQKPKFSGLKPFRSKDMHARELLHSLHDIHREQLKRGA